MKKKIKDVEATIANIVSTEINASRSNNALISDTYEKAIAVIDGYRTSEKYAWQSDVNIPEFFSSYITEASIVASQYFQTRDFVEVYLEGDNPEDKDKCDAVKRLINKMLNRKDLYYFQKLIRASAIRQLAGVVYMLCWWEQEIEEIDDIIHEEQIIPGIGDNPPTRITVPRVVKKEKIIKDHFNCDVIDPRNVFVSPEYTYSIQEKRYVIIRHEKSYDELEKDKELCNYFNLDKVKELKPDPETETARESYNKDTRYTFPYTAQLLYDVYERYGKFWAIVLERDKYGVPLRISPGIDPQGNPLEKAELIETIITFVKSGSNYILIRFDPQRNVTSKNIPYRPIVRGIYYIHPSRSEGSTDTEFALNLQEAINDTINISNDRVMLATFPAFKLRRNVDIDPGELVISPNKPLLLDDPANDLQELKISDNIQGAMAQFAGLVNELQQVRAIFPTTMGNIGSIKASTTATAVAGAEQRADTRMSYKALSFEYTFNCELYWIMLQMAYQYMREETAREILGDLIVYFDPDADYTYKPVTSAVELEQSKRNKIQNYINILQIVSNLKHPQAINVANYILQEILKLMGGEYSVLQRLFQGSPTQEQEQGQPISTGKAPKPKEVASSNQYGMQMSLGEQTARGI